MTEQPTQTTHPPSRRWSSPPASSPLAGGISPSWSSPGEFCRLAAVTELHDAAILHLFLLGASYHHPMDLPDTTGLCWREGIYRCLGSFRSRVGTSPLVSLLAPPSSSSSPLVLPSSPSSPRATSSSALPERHRASPRRCAARASPRDCAARAPPRDCAAIAPPRDCAAIAPPRDCATRAPPRDCAPRAPPRRCAARAPPRRCASRAPPRVRAFRAPFSAGSSPASAGSVQLSRAPAGSVQLSIAPAGPVQLSRAPAGPVRLSRAPAGEFPQENFLGGTTAMASHAPRSVMASRVPGSNMDTQAPRPAMASRVP